MKIRQELAPAQRRIVSVTTVAAVLLVWFIVTLPILPPLPPPPPRAELTPLGEAPRHSRVQDTAADALVRDGDTAGAGPAAGVDPGQSDAATAGETAPVADAAAGSTAQADAGPTKLERPHLDAPPPPAPGPRPIVPATILPSPLAVLRALAYLHTEEGLVRSAAMSFYRITVSFLFAALVAIPLGILMGTYPPLRNAIEPFSNPLRYLPISAITGLFILLFGIMEKMKIAFLFTGTVVYLLPIVVECVQRVDDIYLETAYTLGAKPAQIIMRVLVPAAWPGIFEACRVIYGIGWTYVILAELINVEYGLGHLIEASYKRGHIDWAYALVLVILLLGVGTNELFSLASRKLFAWREAE